MQSIFKIFQDLKNETPSKIDGFTIANLPQIKNHKIGRSQIFISQQQKMG